MALTLEHFLDLIDELPKGVCLDYVKAGTNKIQLDGVDHVEKYILATKVDTEKGSTKSANITTENLRMFVNTVVENKPLHIESVWNGSGSARSAWEGLFAHTSEFYTYFSKGRKHLVWIPTHPHTAGEITPLTKELLEYLSTNKSTTNERVYKYIDIITAVKTKPFLLLAGISGTGKSRIVRELARACWDEGTDEYLAQKPKNFEMIQIKPNWHDSTELMGYVSRVSGEPIFIAGDFLKFIAKAWENLDVPYFLCLDEMNLAPVEQYFAEFLSVIESRKKNGDGHIITDPILKPEFEINKDNGTKRTKVWYGKLITELLAECPPEKMFALTKQFEEDGISIPQNLIVVGTVNMDETTFSFSRKVLDRAMTIEMNEVDLYAGLDSKYERIGKLNSDMLIGIAVEGVDVYADNEDVCNKVLTYLQAVNDVLNGTPFKVAYRTRNEFLLYVVNKLPYNMDENGNEFSEDEVIATALDEITCMKILSRIEGDDTKVKHSLLERLITTIEAQLLALTGEDKKIESVSIAKLKEMQERLSSGYTSFWS